MKNIIKNIFVSHLFDHEELEFGDLYVSQRENHKYFWLVVAENSLSQILEKQDEWFSICQTKIQDKDFKKNASLLVLCNKQENEVPKKQILSIEEDPYQFKKMVLVYTENALTDLLKNSNGGNIDRIRDLIIDDLIFQGYKSEVEYGWRSLLYSLAHKIPFLEINVESNQNLDNLFQQSRESLQNANLFELYSHVDQNFDDTVINTLASKNLEEVIQLLQNEENNGNQD